MPTHMSRHFILYGKVQSSRTRTSISVALTENCATHCGANRKGVTRKNRPRDVNPKDRKAPFAIGAKSRWAMVAHSVDLIKCRCITHNAASKVYIFTEHYILRPGVRAVPRLQPQGDSCRPQYLIRVHTRYVIGAHSSRLRYT